MNTPTLRQTPPKTIGLRPLFPPATYLLGILMSSTQEQIPPNIAQKSRPIARQSVRITASKRFEATVNLHSAEFYESLSKVLISEALKELDGRVKLTVPNDDLLSLNGGWYP